MEAKLITVDDAAAIFQARGLTDITGDWVNDAIDRGLLPCTVVKRRRRVREDRVTALIDRWLEEAG